jgi:ABC-type Fe3+/spermidine/putrescine transport system ATPase subunit
MTVNHDIGLYVKNIKKLYPEFLLEVSFTVEPGEFVSLIGPSGCGKSTTLSLISGLLPADEGTIVLNGINQGGIPVWKRSIGMVFQDYALFPHMNVAKNIGYGLRVKRRPAQEIRSRTEELLKLVNLRGYENRPVSQLSGGEQQRVALIRALAAGPDLLLLDEPLSALDAQLRKSLRREIRSIQRRTGLTTLYVTHDQEEALAVSDRIIIMRDGKIEQSGTPEEVYHHPATLFAAEFFGRASLIPAVPGHINGKTSDLIIHAAPAGSQHSGGISLPFRCACGDEEPQRTGHLFFRPETAEIIAAPHPEFLPDRGGRYNLFTDAVVRDAEYAGTGYYIDAVWNGCLLTVFSRFRLPDGSRITVQIPKDSCWFIPSPP